MGNKMQAKSREQLKWIAVNGPFVSKGGFATTELHNAMVDAGLRPPTGPTLTRWEREGFITRKMNGKRTHRIAATVKVAHEFGEPAPFAEPEPKRVPLKSERVPVVVEPGSAFGNLVTLTLIVDPETADAIIDLIKIRIAIQEDTLKRMRASMNGHG